jgi:cyclic pyranopterin phosphate synthase
MIGVKRINVSIDTLDEGKFKDITRWGDLNKVLDGLKAAQEAGLAVKINMVALKNFNEHEIVPMIEVVPRPGHGPDPDRDHAAGRDRGRPHRPVPAAVAVSAPTLDRFTLEDIPYKTGGPARYVRWRRPADGSASSRR